MTAVEVVVENLKKMSKQVSTPEEIAQVSQVNYFMNKLTISEEIALVIRSSKNLNYTYSMLICQNNGTSNLTCM